MWPLAVSEFWPNGQRVNSAGESPGSETCWVSEGLLECAVSDCDCEPPGTVAGVPDSALKPVCDTWAVCHSHKHRQCDT